MQEKEIGVGTSTPEKASSNVEREADADHSSISSASTDSISSEEEVHSIHQTLSRNAGLEDRDKGLAHITTVNTNMTTDPRFEVDFDNDGENPQDWSMAKKGMAIGFMSFSTLVVVYVNPGYKVCVGRQCLRSCC